MKRRVFVALGISHELAKVINAWKERYSRLPVRWLSSKNLHITIIPPWYEGNVRRLVETLQSLENHAKPFQIEFKKVSFGPSQRSPRLVWAKGDTPHRIVALRDGIAAALGIHPEPRPFTLHLTLARFRLEEFRSFPIQRLSQEVDWSDDVTSFRLMESHLSPGGADYTIVEQFPLHWRDE
ncbi:MAG: RNA 2',3'-cyclic phosphodiesterase [Candidatus Liptonbacteria bacterium]|nr:RNA 2',3'-cyclic phosphodiesterase [Candidatus Liptonbacteria bacterium]